MKKRGEPLTKKELKKEILQRIKHLNEKGHLTEREVYNIVKFFFQEYLQKKYEFTAEELKKELEKVYLDKEAYHNILLFLTDLETLQTESRRFPTEELKNMLKRFKKITDQLLKSEEEKESILQKLLRFSITKKTSLEEEITKTNTLKELIDKINTHINNGNKTEATNTYKELLKIYNSARDTEKEKIYPEILKTYKRLQN